MWFFSTYKWKIKKLNYYYCLVVVKERQSTLRRMFLGGLGMPHFLFYSSQGHKIASSPIQKYYSTSIKTLYPSFYGVLQLNCFFFLFVCGCWKLQQKTRIERVIGFVLAIWGILFYSRLLSTMTEQFRVSFFLYKHYWWGTNVKMVTGSWSFLSCGRVICKKLEKGLRCKS